jgi:uncharacterized protein (TIGR03032 family)
MSLPPATATRGRTWQEARAGNGCVIDIASSEAIAFGLTMPHSARLADGRLYLCNAGTGELGELEIGSGRFNPIAFCPGFCAGSRCSADCPGWALITAKK